MTATATAFFTGRPICFTLTVLTLFIILQLGALNNPVLPSFSSSQWALLFDSAKTAAAAASELNRTRSMLRESITFLPLKDLRFAHAPTSGNTWFMSSLTDTVDDPDDTERLSFPSPESAGRLLCIGGSDVSDGSKNSYALAWTEALPHNAVLLPGLTFVSDTHYDYSNIWHGLAALVPFVSWHTRNSCELPARWVLYHWGELRKEMGPWVRSIAEAAIGENPRIETFDGSGDGPTCFEKAVVFRHNEGRMKKERKQEVYDTIRCRARAYCNVTGIVDRTKIRMTLFFRTGSRSFKDEPAVVQIFKTECQKVEGCRIKFSRPNNLSFCDQVRLMSETDLLVSPHGAQLTNMMFMNKGSSVMEFFPKGWLELAGVGQYVYKWMADWSGMNQRGQWRDPVGDRCPHNNDDDCFTFYKDGAIGHDESIFTNWTASVLRDMRSYKLEAPRSTSTSNVCPCG